MKTPKAFITICYINITLLLLCGIFPELRGELALKNDHLWLVSTWITSLFTHAGVGHLLGNMLFVLPWAWYAEHRLGAKGFALLWIGTGLFGSLLSLLTPSLIVSDGSIGCSGCCMGIMAYSASSLKAHPSIKALALLILALVGVQEYAATVVTALIPDGIAHSAHVGGMVAGLFCASPIGRKLCGE